MTNGIECTVCRGTGWVVWEDGEPRAMRIEDHNGDECPACQGTGIEPRGDGQSSEGK